MRCVWRNAFDTPLACGPTSPRARRMRSPKVPGRLADQLAGPTVRDPDDEPAHRARVCRATSRPSAAATRSAMLSCTDGLPRSSSPMTRRLTPTTSASALWLRLSARRRSRTSCPNSCGVAARMVPIGTSNSNSSRCEACRVPIGNRIQMEGRLVPIGTGCGGTTSLWPTGRMRQSVARRRPVLASRAPCDVQLRGAALPSRPARLIQPPAIALRRPGPEVGARRR